MTKMLPVLLAVTTALITTALVHAFYAIVWLGHYVFANTPAPFDREGALSVSGIATTVVLLAGLAAQRLLAARPMDPFEDSEAATVSVEDRQAAARPE